MLPMVLALLQAAALLLSNHAAFTDAAFTDEQKREIVNIHNRLREAAYPTPTKMNFLTWNTRLESLAQNSTDKCQEDHNYGGEFDSLGENIYKGFKTNPTDIVLNWYSEKAIYNYASNKCMPKGDLVSCGHYCQVVMDSTQEVGCAHTLCPKGNIVFCIYNSGQGAPPYTSSSPEFACSKCPPNRRLCLSGLCVNSSIVGMADVQGFDSTATAAGTPCKLSCPNCGERTPDCTCKCDPAIASGPYCENRVEGSQLMCTLCTQLNTPCLNGGVEQSDATNCICKCTDEYVGKQCQLYKPHYENAMELAIGSHEFCAYGSCLRVPVTRTVFKRSIWSGLRTAIVKAVNDFCNANQENFTQCCPKTAAKPSSDKPLVADADVAYMEEAHMITDDRGLLYVPVYVKITPANNQLCPGSRRRRAASGERMLPQAVLKLVIQQDNSPIRDALGSSGSSIVTLLKPGEPRNPTVPSRNRASRLGAGGLLLFCLGLPLLRLVVSIAV